MKVKNNQRDFMEISFPFSSCYLERSFNASYIYTYIYAHYPRKSTDNILIHYSTLWKVSVITPAYQSTWSSNLSYKAETEMKTIVPVEQMKFKTFNI